MNVLTLNTTKRKKTVLAFLTLLMVSTGLVQAIDHKDYYNIAQYSPPAGQDAAGQIYQQPTQFNSLQYHLRGIALFSGTDLVSGVIKGVTHSHISHVGIILSDVNDKDQWYCFESTGSASEVLKGSYPHVRITPWDIVAQEYSGDISCRLFNFNDVNQPDPRDVTNFVG
ncbi:MAG: hypothetical protein K0M45_07845 [Candidatus Paracaedibacteraceae bacterium]|nr:hypothetical protein [Candidatus Paracaedibacteraceae bacterium]